MSLRLRKQINWNRLLYLTCNLQLNIIKIYINIREWGDSVVHAVAWQHYNTELEKKVILSGKIPHLKSPVFQVGAPSKCSFSMNSINYIFFYILKMLNKSIIRHYWVGLTISPHYLHINWCFYVLILAVNEIHIRCKLI